MVGRTASLIIRTAQITLWLSRGRKQGESWAVVLWLRCIFPFGNFQLGLYPIVYRARAHCKSVSFYILPACSWAPTVMTTSSVQLFNFDIKWGQNEYVLSNFDSPMCCWTAKFVQIVYPCLSFFLRWHVIFKAVMRINERSKSLVWGPLGTCLKLFISFSYRIPFKSSLKKTI